MFKKHNCCQSELSNNRLVLSLPDALTPVMWVMDMANEGTFVMRVEQDDNGFYVLQKLSVDGKQPEDIACYAEKHKAVNAMAMISKTIQGQKNNASSSLFVTFLSILKKVIIYGIGLCLLIILAIFIYGPVKIILGNIFGGAAIETVDNVENNNIQPPAIATDPNAAGVPMSADEFLKQRGNSILP